MTSILSPGGLAALTANTASITTTETVVLKNRAAIPAGILLVGSSFRVKGYGQGTGSIAGNGTISIRIGTAGTIGDTLIVASGALALPTAATGFVFDALVTCRATGAGGSFTGNIDASVSGVAGVVSNSIAAVSQATNVALFLSVTAKTAALTIGIIVTDCVIEVAET